MKELKFIHIAKCAGTSIENAGMKLGLHWGLNQKEYYINSAGNSDWWRVRPLRWWHTIPSCISPELIERYDWFTVVRNPYDRILSEYYCKWGGLGSKAAAHTAEQMNTYLINQINTRNPDGAHYTEQHLYLIPDIHIVHFENLVTELNRLMELYSIKGLVLDKDNRSVPKKHTVKDFSDELICLINRVYARDFELFNYPLIEPIKLDTPPSTEVELGLNIGSGLVTADCDATV